MTNTDIFELYRWAVQDPETQIAVLAEIQGRIGRGRPALILREDFAGTAAESIAWVAADENHRAIAVDVDQQAISWAQRAAVHQLNAAAQRIQFVAEDVLCVGPPRVPAADIISVLNFSICYFERRDVLLSYFDHARHCLANDGFLACNLFGGPGAMRPVLDSRVVTPTGGYCTDRVSKPFEYQWEQKCYDAVTGRLECGIHFAIEGEDRIDNAFQYQWRLWTLPELAELMWEAGFGDVQIWRHTYDSSRGPEGVFLGPVKTLKNLDVWIAYVVGIR